MELLDQVRDLLGGGTLTLWIALGGLVVLWLAIKAVETVVKVALLSVAGVLLLGAAPWSGAALEGAEAECAAAAVEEASTGWPRIATKRITVDDLSPGVRCNDAGNGLAEGAAAVSTRTFFDVPLQRWEVTPGGATSTTDLPGT